MYSYPHVIIIAVGRSGSTVLQSILNTSPYTLIRGENNNFFYWLFKSYQSLTAPGPRPRGLAANKPWYGYEHFNPRSYLEHARALAREFLLGKERAERVFVLGFKEIRFFEVPAQDLHPYLDFLELLFPGVMFVLLQRDPAEICKSSWWKRREASQLKQQISDFYASVSGSDRKNLVSIDHAKLRGKDIGFLEAELFRPLDLPFRAEDVTACLGEELNHCK